MSVWMILFYILPGIFLTLQSLTYTWQHVREKGCKIFDICAFLLIIALCWIPIANVVILLFSIFDYLVAFSMSAYSLSSGVLNIEIIKPFKK